MSDGHQRDHHKYELEGHLHCAVFRSLNQLSNLKKGRRHLEKAASDTVERVVQHSMFDVYLMVIELARQPEKGSRHLEKVSFDEPVVQHSMFEKYITM